MEGKLFVLSTCLEWLAFLTLEWKRKFKTIFLTQDSCHHFQLRMLELYFNSKDSWFNQNSCKFISTIQHGKFHPNISKLITISFKNQNTFSTYKRYSSLKSKISCITIFYATRKFQVLILNF